MIRKSSYLEVIDIQEFKNHFYFFQNFHQDGEKGKKWPEMAEISTVCKDRYKNFFLLFYASILLSNIVASRRLLDSSWGLMNLSKSSIQFIYFEILKIGKHVWPLVRLPGVWRTIWKYKTGHRGRTDDYHVWVSL